MNQHSLCAGREDSTLALIPSHESIRSFMAGETCQLASNFVLPEVMLNLLNNLLLKYLINSHGGSLLTLNLIVTVQLRRQIHLVECVDEDLQGFEEKFNELQAQQSIEVRLMEGEDTQTVLIVQ